MAQIPCFVMGLGILLSADNTWRTRSLLIISSFVRMQHLLQGMVHLARTARTRKGMSTFAVIWQWQMRLA